MGSSLNVVDGIVGTHLSHIFERRGERGERFVHDVVHGKRLDDVLERSLL